MWKHDMPGPQELIFLEVNGIFQILSLYRLYRELFSYGETERRVS